jgi:glycosyltransferase involved in cell wall biosynthesis
MPLALKVKKSAGVPVTTVVHRLLTAANAARARSDWGSAAKHYGSALEQDPHLAHIWIQLGHALKEGGDLAAAEAAYRRAERLQPANADPLLHLGHVSKLRGDVAGAVRHYLAAARLAPRDPAAVGELHKLIADGPSFPVESLAELLAEEDLASTSWSPRPLQDAAEAAQRAVHDLVTALERDAGAPDALTQASSAANLIAEVRRSTSQLSDSQDSRPALIFDVADLLAYFRDVRSPTGIQRVQMETIIGALQISTATVRICCFLEQRDEWVEIPPPLFRKLCQLSLGGVDGEADEWNATLTRTLLLLKTAPSLTFPRGAFLVNLGTSWWQQNYFLLVRQVKSEYGVRYVPFVHDMIPLLRGEYCPKGLRQEFVSWAIGVFEHADFFFVNSQATKRDLVKVGAFLGREISAEAVSVVPLDADHRKAGTSKVGRGSLRWRELDGAPFVLLVSTIEPRKNHIRVFEAWVALLKRHGPRRTPKLLCVGHPGWMNESIYGHLNSQETLREHVRIVRFVSDSELAELYGRCLFTLYPSHYEGWGLPVTESLCHGKAPLIADNSSLREAGDRFASYFNADSTPDLIAALETLIFDPEARRARERLIASEFKPRAWGDLAWQMADSLAAWGDVERTIVTAPPTAWAGAYHPLRRNRHVRIWPGARSSEIYRAGANWWGLDDWGCWTKPGGAILRFAAPEGAALRLYLRLQGLPTVPCPYRVTSGAEVIEGELHPHESKWLAINLPEGVSQGDHPTVELEIRGLAFEDLSTITNNSDPRVVSVGVAGFFLCRADDVIARSAFLEAAALGNVDDLDFNREPVEYVPLI